MNRILIVCLVLLSCMIFACQHSNNSQSFAQAGSGLTKNVIFILADDYGYEVPHIDGADSSYTPNIDSLGMQGARFTQCHASPLCSPSRTALLTGLYNFRNYKDWGLLDTSFSTFGDMFKAAGYATGFYGKWQLGGGDTGIRKAGADQYCMWNATDKASDKGSRYRNPQIYTNGALSIVDSGYGEDVFTDSVLAFIDQHKEDRFFIYYPMVTVHDPFCPTPIDSEFYSWPIGQSNEKWFPSMARYNDRKIGKIINKLKTLGLDNNTIVVFSGDNGTGHRVTTKFNGQDYAGGKGQINEHGTHVPLIVWGSGITPKVDSSLIEFQDFLPSLAQLANIRAIDSIDGISFAPQVWGNTPAAKHDWIYNYYIPLEQKDSTTYEWVQDYTYKMLYNHTTLKFTFSWVVNDSPIVNPTPDQSVIKKKFKNIIQTIKN